MVSGLSACCMEVWLTFSQAVGLRSTLAVRHQSALYAPLRSVQIKFVQHS